MAAAEPGAAGSFPLGELPRDVLVASSGLLGALDLACAGAASRLFLLVAREVQRRPELIVEVGTPGDVVAALGKRLVATPTVGFLFGTDDLSTPDVKRALARRLPVGCQVVGATTPMLQALVPPAAEGSGPPQTELRHVEEDGQITLMLGSFPDAGVHAFHVSSELCARLSRAESDAAAAELLLQQSVPTGDEWKIVVLMPASGGPRYNPMRVVKAYQRCCRHAAIIGGMAGDQVLLHRLGKTRTMDSGVVGLAMRGEAPLTALVSRGCSPLSQPLLARGATLQEGAEEEDSTEPDDEKQLMIPELTTGEGSTVKPIEIAIKAQESMNRRAGGGMFSGVRLSPHTGYVLDQVSQQSFARGGGMCVPWGGGDLEVSSSAGEAGARSPAYCEVRFFQLSPQACKEDLQRLLGYVRAQCEERDEHVLGSIMFTCGARTRRFFGEDCADAKRFKEAFPSVPLVGFWAGGEIGPQALAEAAPNEATRTGNADVQGFTAVFGIFRVPKPSCGTLLATLGDDQVPAEVGAVFARMAQEAKDRGNAAFREADVENAVAHYSRAVDLAAVPSAAVEPIERATIFANRALAQLKADGGAEAALQDAETAVGLDPSNSKAHYRQAQALLGLKRPHEAAAVLRSAVALLPKEQALTDLLAKVEKDLQ